MSLREIVRHTALGRLLVIPFRLGWGLTHSLGHAWRVLKWAFTSKEYYNHTYDLTPLNRDYLYGSYFFLYLRERYGQRAVDGLIDRYSRNLVPFKINEAARNSQLRQTYVAVNRRLQALRFRSNFQIPKWDRAIHDHDEMLKALDDRDGRRLATILRQHLLDKRDAVLQIQSNEDAAGASLKA